MSAHNQSPKRVIITSPKEWAAGVPAVVSAYKHMSQKVGPIAGNKLLSELNQMSGFDCPGCAWPDPLGERSNFEFCENGAKAVADEAMLAKVDASFFKKNSVDALKMQSDKWLNAQGRLTQPMYLAQGASHYEPITWTEAIKRIADSLNALNSPDEAAFYTSGRTSNEAAFLYQLFVRMFGTNNMPDCSNMCHESSGVGLNETIGVGKGTVSLEDLQNAEAIFIFGQNPGSNHPRMLSALQIAKRNGAKIVSVNPLDETGLKRFKNPQEVSGVIGGGTELRDIHVPVKINGDSGFLIGLCKGLFEKEAAGENVLDRAFIEDYCDGFDTFKQHIESYSWEELERTSGVSHELMQQCVEIAAKSTKSVCCWAMGMTQHKNAVANIQLMTNFLMLQGNLGKPGAGVCPVRGHSNVQGDRTMGIWEKPSDALLDSLAKEFSFEPPRKHGVDTVESIEGMSEGHIKVFFALGGNYYRATPDHDKTASALSQCELTVQVSTKLNRSHLYTGKQALILPALGRTEQDVQAGIEQFVTVENSMGVIQTSQGRRKPASTDLKSEVTIVAELAHATLTDSPIPWLALSEKYSAIREHIGNVIPGFENFNQRIEQYGEFVLPNAVRDERVFNTTTKRARFIVNPLTVVEVPEGQLLMMSIRSHDQFNTTVYTDDDRYRGIQGSRRIVLINKNDREKLGLLANQQVDIHSHWQKLGLQDRVVENFQLVDYEIPPGCVATYYPESNNLVPLSSVAEKSNTPAYKSVVVSLHSR